MFEVFLYNNSFVYRLTPREFNSYGSRRGNDAVMARGTFANIRLVNKFIGAPGPKTKYMPSGEIVRTIYRYKYFYNFTIF